MGEQSFDEEKLIAYWLLSADNDYETMEIMYDTKRYSWSLFIRHLVIEKLLKAYYVKINDDFPPFIHNLLRLAEKCKMDLTREDKFFFATTTTFNINTRYDDYKMSFYKRCTPAFTSEWIEKIKEKRLWIKRLIEL